MESVLYCPNTPGHEKLYQAMSIIFRVDYYKNKIHNILIKNIFTKNNFLTNKATCIPINA